MRKYWLITLCAVVIASMIEPAFAQENWGDMQSATGLLQWLTGPVAIVIVAIGLIGGILMGLWQGWMAGISTFAVVCVLGAVFGKVLDIASGIVGSTGTVSI